MTTQYHHFQILKREDGTLWELGRGTMGVTYRARDMNLKADVALKVISSLQKPEARENFSREARAAASLRHVNVVSIFHLGEQDGECFYAMELVSGQTLDQRLREKGKLPAEQALDIVRQVARALGAAERQGLVHKDIQPANLILAGDEDGRTIVKVIDFGLAQQGPGTDDAGHFQGTPEYASPEQIQGLALDVRSDIYSLGATLYHMLAGHPPFAGSPGQILPSHLGSTPPPAPLAGVPADVRDLTLRMLAKSPSARPQTAADLRGAIKLCAGTAGPPAAERRAATPPPLPPLPPVGQKPRRMGPLLFVGAIVVGVLALAGSALVFLFSPPSPRLVTPAPVADPPPELVATPPVAVDPPKPVEPATPVFAKEDTLAALLADAAALQAKDRYAAALEALVRSTDKFPRENTPRERMEMIAAFLRSNAFFMTSKKFAEMRPALEGAAARDVISAQVLLGEQLRSSDPSAALKWFQAAAQNGQTEAMTQAGLMLASGVGTTAADTRRAVGWFQQAAAAGDSDAMTALAECLIFGKGTDPDPRRAAELLRTAVAFKHPGALNLLGDLYLRGSGVPRDASEAFRLFSRAAEQGSGEGLANLGVLYMNGTGVKKNPSMAVSLWKSGAARGFPSCMVNYAKALEAGTGTPADAAEASRWYREAARAGNSAALEWCKKKGVNPGR